MQRLALTLCARCRLSIFASESGGAWLRPNGQLYFRRFRSSFKPRSNPNYSRPRATLPKNSLGSPNYPEDAISFLPSVVERWASLSRVHKRLQSFGIPRSDFQLLLKEFVHTARSGELTTSYAIEKYDVIRLSGPFPENRKAEMIDRILTNIFYSWVIDPKNKSRLEGSVPASTIVGMQQLLNAADLTYPADLYPQAREIKRKVIMHVGPTNSGKTHNALRALAAAKSGLYAGPLRLLAHEVWERLTLGQIVPLGDNPGSAATADPVLAPDILEELQNAVPTVRKDGNPKYARVCNLLTGEEQRILHPEAPLLSATVEMVSSGVMFDVAVVDEIQMVEDEERGGAWTSAVLGLCANELHLCGEERAVPIIQEILKETGDELVIKRYERLTPLLLGEPLQGDLTRVRKGDCLVTFSRTRIFELKNQVEKLTGLRCAVAYGRLPPEVRSAQAALFNDQDSEYDVMIGSDALGMGLNLKIKRIIFASIRKWDGRILRPLSTSQIKQIAGRAGRYNMHGDDLPGGLATTLHADDLPILEQALAAPLLPIQRAFITTTRDHRIDVMQALPPRPTTLAIYEVDLFISNMRSIYRPEESNKLDEQCQFIDSAAGELTLADRELFIKMPLGYRDPMNVKVATAFMHMFKNSMRVILLDGIKNTDLLDTLRRVEASMLTAAKRGIQIPHALELLESFHKVLVMYLWLSMRNPSAFCDYQIAVELKERVEKALQWCLINVSRKTAFKNMRRGHSFVPHNKVFHPRRSAPIRAYS